MTASHKRQGEIARALTSLVPGAPYFDAQPIREAAAAPHMRALSASSAVWLALIAHVRHNYTEYDALRDEGYDKDTAFFFIADTVNAKLTEWRARKFLNPENRDL